jgi:hypothetical protein
VNKKKKKRKENLGKSDKAYGADVSFVFDEKAG